MINIKELGFNIKEQRIEKQLTQADVARHCGVSVNAYQRWEDGTAKQIRDENYRKLEELLA